MSAQNQGYVEWVGSTPREWSSRRVKALFRDDTGNITVEQLALLEVDHYSIPAFDELGAPAREDGATIASNKTQLRGGELLFSKLNSHKPRLWLVPEDDNLKVASTEFIALREWHNGTVSKAFIRHLLGSVAFTSYISCFQTSVTNSHKRINPEDLWRSAIPIPPRGEQERIAAYLDASCAALDATVTAKRRQLEALDALRKSVVQNAVTNGLNATVTRRSTDSLYLPAVPAHWNVWSLKRCATILNGYAFDSTTYVEEGIPIIRIGDVATVIDWTKVKRVPHEFLAELSRFRLERDDILVALTGATIGKSAIYRDETTALLNQRVAIFRASRIHPQFLNYIIQTQVFTEPIDLLCYGGAQDNIGRGEVGGIKIPVPPRPEQESIVHFLNEQTDRFKSLFVTIECQIETLIAYRKSLIHECVTGQRRVTKADLNQVQRHA